MGDTDVILHNLNEEILVMKEKIYLLEEIELRLISNKVGSSEANSAKLAWGNYCQENGL